MLSALIIGGKCANSCVYDGKADSDIKDSQFCDYSLSAGANFNGHASVSNYNSITFNARPCASLSFASLISSIEAELAIAGCTQTTFPTSEVKSAADLVVEDAFQGRVSADIISVVQPGMMALALPFTRKGGEA